MKFLIIFLGVSFLFGTSTSHKIDSSKNTLTKTSVAQKKASRKLSKIAKDIKTLKEEIGYLEKKIDALEVEQSKSEQKLEGFKEELVNVEDELQNMSHLLEQKQSTFTELLATQLSTKFAMEQSHEPTKEAIISYEFHKAYQKENSKRLVNLKKDIKTLKRRQKSRLYLRNKTKQNIETIGKKRQKYTIQKRKKEKLYKKLSVEEERYTQKLQKLVDKQNVLRSTLAKLNILHKKEVVASRKQAQARKKAMRLAKERAQRIRKEKALAKRKAKLAKEALRRAKTKEEKRKARLASIAAEKEKRRVYKQSAKVKQVNSSYKKSKTYKYRGRKTISPIQVAKVLKKFGTYTDPIYNIKIFNESVTLKSKTRRAKVHNVLNGKVVFAGKSSMLGRVVVVEHSHKMHTVYAGLSMIAPTIHVGSKIRKGYVIGKINSKLLFQATKNSKHINPLRLIKI